METRGKSSLKRVRIPQSEQHPTSDIDNISLSTGTSIVEDLQQQPPSTAVAGGLILEDRATSPGGLQLETLSADVGLLKGLQHRTPCADNIFQNLRAHCSSNGPSATSHAPVMIGGGVREDDALQF